MSKQELLWFSGLFAVCGWLGAIACASVAIFDVRSWDVAVGPLLLVLMLAAVMTVIFLDVRRWHG